MKTGVNKVIHGLVAATSLISAAPAIAQDLGNPGGSGVFDWSGFYAGVFGGGAAGEFDADADDDDVTTDRPPPTSAPSTNGQALLAEGEFDYGDFSIDDESWLAGANVGFNIQNGRLVFGAVGDIMGTDLSGSASVYQGSSEPEEHYYGTVHTSADWLATLRALLGVTSPDGRFLFYLTGGLAFTEIEAAVRSYEAATLVEPPPDECGVNLFCDEDSDTVVGVALGAGVGAHLTPRLVLDLSYLFTHFSNTEFEFEDSSQMVEITGNTDVDFSAHLGRIGLTYYFGGGLPPP